MTSITMPRPGEETKALFRAVLPDDERVQARPMFGQPAGFVNGNLFTGVYGDSIMVRLRAASDRAKLLGAEGAAPFEPMPGRPMKEYVVLPAAWMDEPERVREWVRRALASTAALPPKPQKVSDEKRPA